MTQNRRTFMGRVAATAGIAAFGTGVTGAASEPETITFQEDFETLDANWRVDSDLGGSYYTGYWDVSRRAVPGHESQLVEFVADGQTTPGMIWVYTPIDVEPGVAYDSQVSLRTYTPGSVEEDVRLHACLAPSLPASADEFPDKFEAWQLEGDRLGINTSLAAEDGWTEVSRYWPSPELDTDQLYLAVGVSTEADTTAFQYLDSLEVELTPQSQTAEPGVVEDVSVEELDDQPDPAVLFDEAAGTVTIRNTVQSPTPCHELTVANATVTGNTLDLDLELEETDGYCTQVVEQRPFEMTIDCSELPESIVAGLPNTQRMSATRNPVVANAELYVGEEVQEVRHDAELVDGAAPDDWDAGAYYDPSNDVVHIADEVRLTESCQYPVLADVSVADSTLDVSLGIDEEDGYCLQQVTDEPVHVTVTFENGLPGVVDYTLPQ